MAPGCLVYTWSFYGLLFYELNSLSYSPYCTFCIRLKHLQLLIQEFMTSLSSVLPLYLYHWATSLGAQETEERHTNCMPGAVRATSDRPQVPSLLIACMIPISERNFHIVTDGMHVSNCF